MAVGPVIGAFLSDRKSLYQGKKQGNLDFLWYVHSPLIAPLHAILGEFKADELAQSRAGNRERSGKARI